MNPDAQEEGPGSRRLLEDVRRRLARVFLRVGPRADSRRTRVAAAAAAAAEREDRARARVEGALAALRAELVEMHLQNHQLTRTLLDLNAKMQQLRSENVCEIAADSLGQEDDAVDQE
ncbi:alanine- and arginine-rich domain-containing protein [Tenrec ecaudatus]|uniref:alanine- and arginine-rich domain-containing protein n=1 Tax=Tenrec ecaudatus TaxID=94439 RepID=UPI003F59DF3D